MLIFKLLLILVVNGANSNQLFPIEQPVSNRYYGGTYSAKEEVYYIYASVYSADNKTTYYSNIFPVTVSTDETDDSWHKSSKANLACSRLKSLFDNYLYTERDLDLKYKTVSASYFLTRTEAENHKSHAMRLAKIGGTVISYNDFSFYFNKDE